MHGIIIYRHIGRTGLGWTDGQKSPVFRLSGKSGNPTYRAACGMTPPTCIDSGTKRSTAQESRVREITQATWIRRRVRGQRFTERAYQGGRSRLVRTRVRALNEQWRGGQASWSWDKAAKCFDLACMQACTSQAPLPAL